MLHYKMIIFAHEGKFMTKTLISQIDCYFIFTVLLLTYCHIDKDKIINSVALVRKGTIPTERPPLVGEVRANFCG
jgi:hypothetical protein